MLDALVFALKFPQIVSCCVNFYGISEFIKRSVVILHEHDKYALVYTLSLLFASAQISQSEAGTIKSLKLKPRAFDCMQVLPVHFARV